MDRVWCNILAKHAETYGREGATLCKTILPTIYYLVVTGIIGLVAIYGLRITDALMH